MRFTKKLIAGIAVALTFTATSITAFAATTYQTPCEIVESLTGKSSQQVLEERQSGKTYGTIAEEAGKLEEFKTAMNELRTSILEERVANGSISREQMETILKAVEENQLICDGTGSGNGGAGCYFDTGAGLDYSYGTGYGMGHGAGYGHGHSTGHNTRHGNAGRGIYRGTCARLQ